MVRGWVATFGLRLNAIPRWSWSRNLLVETIVDFKNFEFQGSLGDVDLNFFTDLLAHQGITNRAGAEVFAVVVIFVAGTDKGKLFFVVVVQIEDFHGWRQKPLRHVVPYSDR